MEEVEHVLRDDGPVGVDEAFADVQELSLLAQPRQPGAHQAVDRSVLLPQWVGTLASRQQTLKNNPIFLVSKVLESSAMTFLFVCLGWCFFNSYVEALLTRTTILAFGRRDLSSSAMARIPPATCSAVCW